MGEKEKDGKYNLSVITSELWKWIKQRHMKETCQNERRRTTKRLKGTKVLYCRETDGELSDSVWLDLNPFSCPGLFPVVSHCHLPFLVSMLSSVHLAFPRSLFLNAPIIPSQSFLRVNAASVLSLPLRLTWPSLPYGVLGLYGLCFYLSSLKINPRLRYKPTR